MLQQMPKKSRHYIAALDLQNKYLSLVYYAKATRDASQKTTNGTISPLIIKFLYHYLSSLLAIHFKQSEETTSNS